MHFVGRRVTIRALERSDLEIVASFHNDPAIASKIEFAWPISATQQERFFERVDRDENTKRLVIETPDDGVIGYTGLWGIDWINRRATNGIIVGKRSVQRNGYATDALMTIQRVAFEQLGLHRLDAVIFEFNTASLALYVGKCGWKEEGRRREHIFRDGRFWDAIQVGTLSSEYRAHAALSRYWER